MYRLRCGIIAFSSYIVICFSSFGQGLANSWWILDSNKIESSLVFRPHHDSLSVFGIEKIKKRKFALFPKDSNGFASHLSGSGEWTFHPKENNGLDNSADVETIRMKQSSANFQTVQISSSLLDKLINSSSGDGEFTKGLVYRMPHKIHGIKSIAKLGQSYFRPILFRQNEFFSELVIDFEVLNDRLQTVLHPPGSSDAFYLKDLKGNRYLLVDQFGFDGFGPASFEKGFRRKIVLVFEKVPENLGVLDLIEGDCSVGCWSAYRIKLDKPNLFTVY